MKIENVEKEYEFLRNEIIQDYQIMDSSRNLLYFAVGVILTLSLNIREPFISLLPFIVIIPIYFVTLDYSYSAQMAGAYLQVFYEPEFFHWETRHYELSKHYTSKSTNFSSTFHFPFIITGVGSLMIFAYLFIEDQRSFLSFTSIARLICACVVFIALISIYYKHRNIDSIREDYIAKWKLIKAAEGKNACNNSADGQYAAGNEQS